MSAGGGSGAGGAGGGGGGGSISASKMSRRNRADSEAEYGLFAVLASWDKPANHSSGLSVAIQGIQLFSLAFAPQWGHTYAIVREFSYFVFAFNLPIWDKNYVPVELANIAIAVGVVAAVILLATFFLAGFVTRQVSERNTFLNGFVVTTLTLVSGWLYLPIMHLFMSLLFCAKQTTVTVSADTLASVVTQASIVASFPETTCHASLHQALIVVGTLCAAITFVVSGVFASTLSDETPSTHQRLARAHTFFDIALFVSKTLAVVLFHVLLANDARVTFSILFVLLLLPPLFIVAFCLPYFQFATNATHSALVLCTLFTSLVNAAAYAGPSYLVQQHLHSQIILALLPLVATLGALLPTLRRSQRFEAHIARLLRDSACAEHSAVFPFPRGAAENDVKRAAQRFHTLEKDLINESLQSYDDIGENEEQMIALATATLIPYVPSVVLATDAELSTRFVLHHRELTRSTTGPMLAFAARIFLKAMLHFPSSSVVRYHFACFLFHSGGKMNLALELIDEVHANSTEVNAATLYGAHKLGHRIKALFGIKDASYAQSMARLRHLHKGALSDMALFWSKLVETRGDWFGLAMITDRITEKRAQTEDEYRRIMENQSMVDRQLLVMFAAFLDDVMLQPNTGEEVRRIAEVLAEQKKSRLMHGARGRPESSGGGDTAEAVAEVLEICDITQANGGGEGGGGGSQASGQMTGRMFVIIMASLAALLAASMVVFGLHLQQVTTGYRSVKNIAAIGQVRTGIHHVAYRTSEIGDAIRSGVSADALSANVALTLELVAETVGRHNYATYGDSSQIQSGSVSSDSRDSTTVLYKTLVSPTRPFVHKGFLNQVESPVTSFQVDSAFESAEYGDGWWILVHALAEAATSFLAAVTPGSSSSLAKIRTVTAEYDFIQRNAESSFFLAGSDVALATIAASENDSRSIQGGVAGAFVFGLIVLCFAYMAVFTTLRDVGSLKWAVLRLFSLIPLPAQQQQYDAAKLRVDTFDRNTVDDDGAANADTAEDDLSSLDEGAPSPPGVVEPGAATTTDPNAANKSEASKERIPSGDLAPTASLGFVPDEARKSSRSSRQTRLKSMGTPEMSLGQFNNDPDGRGRAALAANMFDESRKASRFFGLATPQKRSLGSTAPVSILKKPGAKKKTGHHRQVKFRLEAQLSAEKQGATKLKEPVLVLGTVDPTTLIQEFKTSLRVAVQEEEQERRLEFSRREQETERIIHTAGKAEGRATAVASSGSQSRSAGSSTASGRGETERYTFMHVALVTVLALAAAAASLGIGANGEALRADAESTIDDATGRILTLRDFIQDLQSSILSSKTYTEAASPDMYQRLVNVFTGNVLASGLDGVAKRFGFNSVKPILAKAQAIRVVLRIAGGLAARANAATVSQTRSPLVSSFVWPSVPWTQLEAAYFGGSSAPQTPLWRDYSAVLKEEGQLWRARVESAPPGTSNETLAAQHFNSSEVADLYREEAFRVAFQDKSLILERGIWDELREFAERLVVAADADIRGSLQSTTFSGAAAAAGVGGGLGVLIVAAAAARYRNQGPTRRVFPLVAAALGAVCGFIALGLFAGAASVAAPAANAGWVDSWLEHGANLQASRSHALAVAVLGEPHSTFRYIEESYDQIETALAGLRSIAGDSTVGAYSTLATAVDHERRAAVAGVLLSMSARNLVRPSFFDVTPSSFPTTYDVRTEPTYAADAITFQFSSDPLVYTTLEADTRPPTARSVKERIAMARHALLGPRQQALGPRIRNGFAGIATARVESARAEGHDTHSTTSKRAIAGAVFACVTCVCYLAVLLQPAAELLFDDRGGGGSTMQELFSSQLRKLRLSLGVLLVVFVLQFAFSQATSPLPTSTSSVLEVAHRREAVVLRSLVHADALLRALASDETDYLTFLLMRSRITESAQELSAARSILYFDSRPPDLGHMRGNADTQAAVTFGGADSLDVLYLQWIQRLEAIALAVPAFTVAPVSASTVGLDPSFAVPPRFLGGAMTVDAASLKQIRTAVDTLRSGLDPLVTKLRRSNAVYFDDAVGLLDKSRVAAIVLAVVFVLVCALEARFVFAPISARLALDAFGTRLLLGMIPNDIKELVPKITLYLETGVIIEDHVEASVFVSDNVGAGFLRLWTSGASDEQCYAELAQSNHTYIVIDPQGTIHHATSNVTQLIGFDNRELVGKNVKMLMQEPLRSLHDGFLKRYVETGNSKIIGTQGRDVPMLTKAGGSEHVFLSIFEAARSNGALYFVAEVRRYNVEAALSGKPFDGASHASTVSLSDAKTRSSDPGSTKRGAAGTKSSDKK